MNGFWMPSLYKMVTSSFKKRFFINLITDLIYKVFAMCFYDYLYTGSNNKGQEFTNLLPGWPDEDGFPDFR